MGVLDPTEQQTLTIATKTPTPATTAQELKEEQQLTGVPPLERLIAVHDFEKVARENLSAKTFAFYSSAATDLVTQKANIEVWRQLLLRPRVLRNVSQVSMKRRILGCESEAPFFVSPAAMARLAHPDGELAIARGCANEGIIQTVSTRPAFYQGLRRPETRRPLTSPI
jgi:L-lactate dehydrogenase (cytochrome)